MINIKNIIRFLDDLKENHIMYYELLLDISKTYDESITRINLNMRKTFVKYNLDNYIFDCFDSHNYFLVEKTYKFPNFFYKNAVSNKQNSYVTVERYEKVIYIEDLLQLKNILDFSIENLTEEEMFYLKLKYN